MPPPYKHHDRRPPISPAAAATPIMNLPHNTHALLMHSPPVDDATAAQRQQQTTIHSCRHADCTMTDGGDGRSITNPDARTASMRERGRWGNTKQQQNQQQNQAQLTPTPTPMPAKRIFHDSAAADEQCRGFAGHVPPMMQRVRCLHCGSFSTAPLQAPIDSYTKRGGLPMSGSATPIAGVRRVRDYSWKQELSEQAAKKSDRVIRPNSSAVEGFSTGIRRNVEEREHSCCSGHGHECASLAGCEENACCKCEGRRRMHGWGGTSSATWQGRYMMLCRAIAAGAFEGEDSREGSKTAGYYSCADCECESCGGGGGGLKTTTTSERMMELEAFSGPLGYVSESKAAAKKHEQQQQQGISMIGASRRSSWWGKRNSSNINNNNNGVSGGVEVEEFCCCCSGCGRQLAWAPAATSVQLLCSECRSSPSPRRPPPPPPSYRASSFPPKHLPRRWRLIKLCRYLLGFPMHPSS